MNCAYAGGGITSLSQIYAGLVASPTVGATYTAITSLADYVDNVSATFVQSQDNSISAVATPASISVGGASEYLFTVTNNGPGSSPVSFSDTVPTGLNILSALAASGSCTISGQTVSCTTASIPIGTSITVAIAVQAPTAGSYADAATITSVVPDPNPANNLASATLTVLAPIVSPPPPVIQCKTPHLNGLSLAKAKKALLAAHCKVGKITKKTSKGVRKGYVVTTSPGSGKTLPANTAIRIVVSSGRPHKH